MQESPQADPTANAVRVLLANEQSLVRAGIRALLDDQPDILVVAEAEGSAEALDLATEQPELADVALVETDAQTSAVVERLAAVPDLRVLAMTSSAEPEAMLDALRSGARGAIPKTASAQSLPEAVRSVAGGLRWLTPDLERYCEHNLTTAAQAVAEPPKPVNQEWERLTPRERQIAGLVGQGLRHADIAERLGISIHTVKNHLRHIFVKLDVAGRVELAMYVRG